MTKYRNSEPESQLISPRHHHSFGPICRKSHKRNASEIVPFREFWLQKDCSSVVVDPKWCNPWILPTNLQEVSRLWLQEDD
jgi:hypothetical protein